MPASLRSPLRAQGATVLPEQILGPLGTADELAVIRTALDLSIAFTFLPPEARSTFREAYGTIDEATWDRARFRAFHYGVALLLYGKSEGDEAIAKVGHDALRYGAAV